MVETLRKQGKRMEEDRNESVNKYIEDLGGVPETLLSIGMIGPIILAIVGLVPQILGDGAEAIIGSIDQGMINSIVNGGLIFTVIGMFNWAESTYKDPGCDMIFDFMEAFNDNMFVLFLFVIGIACAAGGIPPIIERSRRRGIENQLSRFLRVIIRCSWCR